MKSPEYSEEELASIFTIRKSNVLGVFRSGLRYDLIISVVLVAVFILILQMLNLKTSNFWSTVMAFVGIQHFLIYSLQSFLIRNLTRYTEDVKQSIETSILNLNRLLWHYRIFPTVLSLFLFTFYSWQFDIQLTNGVLVLVALFIAGVVLLISEFLSSILVKRQIKELKKLGNELGEHH